MVPAFWRDIRIQTEAFDLGEEERELRQYAHDAGALVAFQGMVREFDYEEDAKRVDYLFLEHYPEVTENEMARIIDEASNRWTLSGVRVIHRVGELRATDVIVLVLICSRHRKDAFAAAEFIMDYLKTQAPFWKREHLANGEQHWVEAKANDTQALQKWQNSISTTHRD
ncbi:molybdenum cofactor biosynthesis protein MoaE [Hydromonas duriensis]|uniref:Molybdopterin synthase catalytic subunit n=1 Tax=Hydromonas duriensis TaxID=1527608 RepID=A0A4R6Y849_9BURK|nr:molybdenum cofactor biosynthesis protein MoaE [Hydromonas duriensis]TDR31533.1 molybdopterin synthase subunit MoaE [Hydromonas duriensis]